VGAQVHLRFFADLLRPLLSRLPFVSDHYPEFALTMLGLAAIVPVLVLLGLFTRNLVGRAFFAAVDRLFDNIPLVKGLFTTFKQIAAVSGRGSSGRSSACCWSRSRGPAPVPGVRDPRRRGQQHGRGLPADDPQPDDRLPADVDRDELRPAPLTVEEAIRLIVSADHHDRAADVGDARAGHRDAGGTGRGRVT